MHDPKFESAVQDKMEQLEFIPSDSVWENIEAAMTPRRRRAAPVFFWTLAAGLLLVGTGAAIYLRTNTPSVAKNIPIPAGTGDTKNTTPATPIEGSSSAPVAPAVADQSVAGARQADAGFSADGKRLRTTTGHHSGLMAGTTGRAKTGSSTNTGSTTYARSTIDAGSPANTKSTTGVGSSAGAGSATIVSPVTSSVRLHADYQPGLISCLAAVSGIRGPRLSPSSATKTAVTGIPMPKRPWSVGFAGGFGVSSYNQSLLSKATAVTTTTYAYANPASLNSLNPSAYYAPANSSTTSSKRVTSTVEPGLSYWAGITAQKPLSARWSLSLGLDLHYYSSRLRVGGVVTTYSRSASALIGASTVAPVQSYPYYSLGDVQIYTNRYYYLALPVAMQWQINRGRVLPLFLRGGITVSRLMSSNGLYYNDQSAVYFKDNSVIQPMQVSFTSGLIAALPIRGIRIQAGPELQYGATTLLNSGAAGNGRLLYGGLRVTVMR